MKIKLDCVCCGGNRFRYPSRFTDDSLVSCADCDHSVGTIAELEQKVVRAMHGRLLH